MKLCPISDNHTRLIYLQKVFHEQAFSCCHKNDENEKKRAYEERVHNMEHGMFTPLVFSAAGTWLGGQSPQLFING